MPDLGEDRPVPRAARGDVLARYLDVLAPHRPRSISRPGCCDRMLCQQEVAGASMARYQAVLEPRGVLRLGTKLATGASEPAAGPRSCRRVLSSRPRGLAADPAPDRRRGTRAL